jgi:hypothetical protein
MFQIKLAAQLMMPLALFCSLAHAQQQQEQQQPDCQVKPAVPSQPTTQTQTPPPLNTQSQPEAYGSYVPYAGPMIQKAPPAQAEVAAPLPSVCYTPNQQTTTGSSPHPNFSAVQEQQPDSLRNSATLSEFKPANSRRLLAFDSAPSAGESSSTSVYVRPVPAPHPAKDRRNIRPFRSIAIGFKADSLGAGVEIATPLARNFNLRSGINIFSFDYPFTIDGLNYDARLHLKSSETALDWFPLHGSFHISPGILYVKNTVAATTFAGPGQSFTLGTQTFINSVDDPVGGSASLVFPRTLAPMLLIGFGNIIPRSGRHLSVPFEIGAAYTGTPQISVALSGTACTTNGCASFASNALAQTFLKQEIYDLNEDLKRLPVYPIVSLGLAYHF